jgi:hypothetical protein
LLSEEKLDCFASLEMTAFNSQRVRALDFSTRHCNRLPGNGGGSLAAQPEHGIGDFLRRHQTALRIVP